MGAGAPFGVDTVSAQDPYDTPMGDFYTGDHWANYDCDFTAAAAPWDWEVLDADYHLSVVEDFTAGQIIEFAIGESTIQFQPMLGVM